MTSAETEISRYLRAFFEVLNTFWMRPEEQLSPVLPRVNTGTVDHALLLTHGWKEESGPHKLQAIIEVFPEESETIWEDGHYAGSFGAHIYGLQRVTSRESFNEFLISDIVKQKLREAFPEQMTAMKRQEEIRGLENEEHEQ